MKSYFTMSYLRKILAAILLMNVTVFATSVAPLYLKVGGGETSSPFIKYTLNSEKDAIGINIMTSEVNFDAVVISVVNEDGEILFNTSLGGRLIEKNSKEYFVTISKKYSKWCKLRFIKKGERVKVILLEQMLVDGESDSSDDNFEAKDGGVETEVPKVAD